MAGIKGIRQSPEPGAYTLEQAETDLAVLRGQVGLLSELLTQYDFTPGSTPNTPSPSGYSVFSSAGQQKYVGFDGSAYNTGVLTSVYTGPGQVVNSLTAAQVGTVQAALAAGTYRVWGKVWGTNGATSAKQAIRLSASGALAASTVAVDFLSTNYGALSGTISNYQKTSALGADMDTGATLMTNGFSWTFWFDGIIIVSVAGILQLTARCVTLAADTWTVLAPSFLCASPVT